MVLDFYRLKEHPFGVTPNSRYFYSSEVHREALQSLVCGIEHRVGFAALISPPGMGKTSLLFQLLERYGRSVAHTAFLFNTQCTTRSLLREITDELGIKASGNDLPDLLSDFHSFVAKAAAESKPVIIIIDEAQNLAYSALEAVRLLSNFETPEHKLLHIILAGQTELSSKLQQPRLSQLLQRITIITRLKNFSAAQTKSYIEHRLKVAGYAGKPLFSADAVARITDGTGGVPRAINRVCFNALLIGCARNQATIDGSIVTEVLNDLDLGKVDGERLAIPTSRETAPSPASEQVNTAPAIVDKAQRPAGTQPSVSGGFHGAPAINSRDIRPQTPVVSDSSAVHATLASIGHISGTASITPRVRINIPRAAVTPSPEPPVARVDPLDRLRAQAQSALHGRKNPLLSKSLTAGCAVIGLAVSGLALASHSSVLRRLQALITPSTTVEARANTSSRGLPGQSGDLVRTKLPLQGAKAVTAPESIPPPSRNNDRSGTRAVHPEDYKPTQALWIRREASPRANGNADWRGEKNMNVQDTAPPMLANLGVHPAGLPFGDSQPPIPKLMLSTNAELVKRVDPLYPSAAKSGHIQGDVVLEVTVGRDGRVTKIRKAKGNAILAQSAIAAVKQWHYRPKIENGRPQDAQMDVRLLFRLPD